MRPRRWALLALLSVTFAYAFMGQVTNAGQWTHLALLNAMSHGSARIDETRFDFGDQPATDVVYYRGHVYSNKAPGLVLLTLPLYVALDHAGMRTTGDPREIAWAVGLLGNVLPAAILLLLMFMAGEHLVPGMGLPTAMTLGLGTLLLPYASIFYSHALAAMLVFAAFVLLWGERHEPQSRWRLFAAGLLGGYAVASEYPSVFAVAAFALYVGLPLRKRLRRAAFYVAGAVVGVLPLPAYNWWAFGSPVHLSYEGAAGSRLHEATFSMPSLPVAMALLFGFWGLFEISSVLLASATALVVLFRRGLRAESLVLAAIPAMYVVFNTTLELPTGGTAGTRFLIAAIPFLALPLAVAFDKWPLTTSVLAVGSAAVMVAMAASDPFIAYDGHVLERLGSPDGSAQTLADFLGITGAYDIAPFYAAVLGAAVFTALGTKLRWDRRELPGAVAALAAWAVVAGGVTHLLRSHSLSKGESAFLAAFVVALTIAAVAAVHARLEHAGWARPRHGAG